MRAQYLIGQYCTKDEKYENLLTTNIGELYATLQSIYNKNTLLGNTTLTICIQGLNLMTDLHGITGNDLLYSLNAHFKSLLTHSTSPNKQLKPLHFQPVYDIPDIVQGTWTRQEDEVFRRIKAGATVHSHSGLHQHFSATLYQTLVTSHGLKSKYIAAIEALRTGDSTHPLVIEYNNAATQAATTAQTGAAPTRSTFYQQCKTPFNMEEALIDIGYTKHVKKVPT